MRLTSYLKAAAVGALIALGGCVVYQEPAPVYEHEAQPVHIPPGAVLVQG